MDGPLRRRSGHANENRSRGLSAPLAFAFQTKALLVRDLEGRHAAALSSWLSSPTVNRPGRMASASLVRERPASRLQNPLPKPSHRQIVDVEQTWGSRMANDGPTRRRVPRQKRSAFTVNAILQAAGEIIVDDGLQKASTNAIAERAGVSIGTLYQYFSNKSAIVATLREHHEQEVFEALRTAASDPGTQDLGLLIRRMIRANIDAHMEGALLHRVLTVDHPHFGISSKHLLCPLNASANSVFSITEQRYVDFCPSMHPDIEIRPMLAGVFKLVESLTHSLMVDCPAQASTDELEDIVLTSTIAYSETITPNILRYM